jgi:hypothetical protein
MDEAEYHADKALGSSSIKALRVDPFEWQFDNLYGPEIESDAMDFGSGVHARILEGRAAFESKFCSEYDKTQSEGALDTATDIKTWLQSFGQAGLSGKTKPDLIKLALEIDPKVRIVDVLKAEWAAKNAGKTPLKPKRWAQIEVASRWVQRDPLLSAVMEDGTFVSGAPEVSIFYEDRGVRLKARFDRLMRHAIVDLKTFAPMGDGQIDGPRGTAVRTIRRMKYHIQAAAYLRAWERAKELFTEGLVFGDEPFPGFLEECFDRDEPKWIWIMVKSKGAPQPLVVDWMAKAIKIQAAQDVEIAIQDYIDLSAEHGADQEWPPMRPAMTLEDSDLPHGLD